MRIDRHLCIFYHQLQTKRKKIFALLKSKFMWSNLCRQIVHIQSFGVFQITPHLVFFMPPFEEKRAYCFAAVHRQSVSWSVHPQFLFSFFTEVAQTEMQFCIQIYEEYLGQVGFFAVSIHFHFIRSQR